MDKKTFSVIFVHLDLLILLFFLQELKICAAIINIFHLIPAASKKMIEPLIKETLQGEKNLLLEVC